MGGSYFVGKSVVFRDQKGFGYGYGERFRDPNKKSLDKGIVKVNENFETGETRQLFGDNRYTRR